jgi:hypothetical protein
VAEAFDVLDWTEGLVIKQTRVAAAEPAACSTRTYGERCLPELQHTTGQSETRPFGYNWTHPSEPLAHPWRYFDAEYLGASPYGLESAAVPSFRTFEAGGYLAIILPFFSRECPTRRAAARPPPPAARPPPSALHPGVESRRGAPPPIAQQLHPSPSSSAHRPAAPPTGARSTPVYLLYLVCRRHAAAGAARLA